MDINTVDLRVARTFLGGSLHWWQTRKDGVLRIGQGQRWIEIPCFGHITPGVRTWPRSTPDVHITIEDDTIVPGHHGAQDSTAIPIDATCVHIDGDGDGPMLKDLAYVCSADDPRISYSYVRFLDGWAYATNGRVFAMGKTSQSAAAHIPHALARVLPLGSQGVLYTYNGGQTYCALHYTMQMPGFHPSFVTPDMDAYLQMIPLDREARILELRELSAFARKHAKGSIMLEFSAGNLFATIRSALGDGSRIALAAPAPQSYLAEMQGADLATAIRWLLDQKVMVCVRSNTPNLLYMRAPNNRYTIISCSSII